MPFLTGAFGYIKSKQDQIFNLLLGLSFIYWSLAGLYKDLNDLSTVRVCTSLLNFLVGVLIILRQKELKRGDTKSLIASLPSLVLGGLLFKMALYFSHWSLPLQAVFALASIFTLMSFISLGSSFSILPSLRKIMVHGTYRLVRHPAYLGESVMVLCLALSTQKPYAILLFLLYITLLSFRIKEEERLLSSQTSYLEYKKKVKWKLLPLVW